MASLGEVVAGIRAVQEKIKAARAALAEAHHRASETHATWAALLKGAQSPKAAEIQAQATKATQAANEATTLATNADQALTNYLNNLNTPGTPPTQPPETPKQPKSVQAQDGSNYPPEAAWCVKELPRRVFEGGDYEVTVGYPKGLDGGPVRSGTDEWTSRVTARINQLGLTTNPRIFPGRHVEMKVATRMIKERQRHVELTINHAPCGSQPYHRWSGCHQILTRFLPRGYTLIVHGTTQTGTPFAEIYRGRAIA